MVSTSEALGLLWVISGPDGPKVGLPLYPRKRTPGGHRAMSEKCQNQKSAVGIRALAAFRIQKFANKGQEFCH